MKRRLLFAVVGLIAAMTLSGCAIVPADRYYGDSYYREPAVTVVPAPLWFYWGPGDWRHEAPPHWRGDPGYHRGWR